MQTKNITSEEFSKEYGTISCFTLKNIQIFKSLKLENFFRQNYRNFFFNSFISAFLESNLAYFHSISFKIVNLCIFKRFSEEKG